jgi:hypothetical protein
VHSFQRRFKVTCRLHLQCRRIREARNQHEAASQHNLTFSGLHETISHKKELFKFLVRCILLFHYVIRLSRIKVIKMIFNCSVYIRRDIAQAVSRWLPISVIRVRGRSGSDGICGGQTGAGAGFLRVIRFPLPILVPRNSLSSQSPGAGTISQKWPTCQVGPVWTPPPSI